MRGRALLPLLLLVGIACQDSLVPAGEPNIRVVDGANPSTDDIVDPYASSFFFFKSPIVPEPSAFNGAFSPTVQTTVEIWSLGDPSDTGFVKLHRSVVYDAWNGGAGQDPSGYGCYGELRASYSGAAISVDEYTETYELGWNTDTDLSEDDLGYVFRVCVSASDPFGGEDLLLGYRDVSPDANGADIPRDGAELPIYQFNLGRNLPVNYWIGGGALCRDADGRVIDCTTVTLDANGGTSTCNDAQCGIYVPEGAIQAGETATFQVRYVSCDAYNADNTVEYLDIDIPQYFGCLEVSTVATYDWLGYDGLGPGITVASCRDTGILGPQDERLLLHIESDAETDGRKDVYALPTRPFELECDGSTPAPGAQASLGEKAKYYMARGAQALKRTLVPWIDPPVLTAAHAGFGGGTSLSCDGGGAAGADGPYAVRGCSAPSLLSGDTPTLTEVGAGETVTYRAVWALPSEITEKLQVVSDGSGGTTEIPWDGVVYGSLNESLFPAVRVQDECKPDDDPYVLPDGTVHVETCTDTLDVARNVEGAFVTFKFYNASGGAAYDSVLRVRTGADGIAMATWPLPALGSFEAYVGGLGVGVDQALMDYSVTPAVAGTGSYQDHVGNTAVQLATGLVRFEAAACSDKSGVLETPYVDDEYDTGTMIPIPINISGSDGDNATLHITSDCYNVYFALEVPESEDLQNSLRIVFVDGDAVLDETGKFSAVPEVGDDMWFISRNDDKKDTIPDGSWMIEDWHVSDDCTGSSKQSECGKADTDAGGTYDLDGGSVGTVYEVGTTTVFEFARSFENADALDFAVPNIGETGYVAFYLVLQRGKGAQGNTEYPDFRVFQPIEIVRQ
jgi:hypothetical protein